MCIKSTGKYWKREVETWNQGRKDVDDGDIAVVLVNGNDATVKRIRRQNNTVMLIPMSTNPEHQVQIYGPDVPIRILGKVVEVKFKV